jgi:transposase
LEVRSRRPFRDDRPVVEGTLYRCRCAIAWRDVSVALGPWQTVWKRHRRYSGDGTWDRVLAALLTRAQKVQFIAWVVSVDSTISRAHQHATIFPHLTRGGVDRRESADRAG